MIIIVARSRCIAKNGGTKGGISWDTRSGISWCHTLSNEASVAAADIGENYV